jgi:hypothetical protein
MLDAFTGLTLLPRRTLSVKGGGHLSISSVWDCLRSTVKNSRNRVSSMTVREGRSPFGAGVVRILRET